MPSRKCICRGLLVQRENVGPSNATLNNPSSSDNQGEYTQILVLKLFQNHITCYDHLQRNFSDFVRTSTRQHIMAATIKRRRRKKKLNNTTCAVSRKDTFMTPEMVAPVKVQVSSKYWPQSKTQNKTETALYKSART